MQRYKEDDYLLISGIQHFDFCKRQWALIHIEQQWEENLRTVDGRILHERAHDTMFTEKRGNTIITRGMAVSSPTLGITGECDVVEFHKTTDGVKIDAWDGLYQVIPVEYKRGKGKISDCDRMQLTAQALCLEEMLCCNIFEGYLYYGETKHREKIVIDDSIREKTKKAIEEMHIMYRKMHTPNVKRTKSCNACSLKDVCLPELGKLISASSYLSAHFFEESDETIT